MGICITFNHLPKAVKLEVSTQYSKLTSHFYPFTQLISFYFQHLPTKYPLLLINVSLQAIPFTPSSFP